MKMKKAIAAVMAVTMLVPTVTGCGKDENAVITFRDTTIGENEYIFLLSSYKAELLSGLGFQNDNPELWSTKVTGEATYGQFYNALYADQIMTRAIWLQLFDEYNLKLTEQQEKAVEDWVDEWIRYLGGKAALNDSLAIFGVNAKMLKKIKLDDLKVNAVQNYLFGENGTMKPNDEEMESYYEENYYRTKYIRLSKEKEYDFGEDGNPIYDEENDVFLVHEMSEEEFAAKEALYGELQTELVAGGDFEALMNKHTMESGMIYFEDGYYFNSASTILPDEVKKAVMDCEIGEWVAVETETDWYIAKRYELTEKPYLETVYLNSMFTTLATDTLTYKQMNYISTLNSELVYNLDDMMTKFPFATITPNFYFK